MKIGFNCSTLDLFHVGHVTMLREERRHCDYLIIALQTDPTIDRPDTKNKPVQSVYERYMQLSACRYVDEVIVYSTEEDLLNMLKTIHIDIRFLGDEYKTKEFTGKQWCLDHGIELHYHEREHPYSSSALRERVWAAEQQKRTYPQIDITADIKNAVAQKESSTAKTLGPIDFPPGVSYYGSHQKLY